jgi:hypothetical protein
MRTKLAVVFLAVTSICTAAINPQFQWNTSVPGAGPVYFANNVIWTATGESMAVISPTTHAVLFQQSIGQQANDCDIDPALGNMWCVGSGSNPNVAYVSVFNLFHSVQSGGRALSKTWTFVSDSSVSSTYSISVDEIDSIAFIVAGGNLYNWNISMNGEGIINQYTAPDGYSVQNATFMPICDRDVGLLATTLGILDGFPVAHWWYYDLGSRCVQGGTSWYSVNDENVIGQNNLFVPEQSLKPVYVFSENTEPEGGNVILSESVPLPNGTGSSWLILPPFGRPGAAYLNYNNDAISDFFHSTQAVGQAFDSLHSIYISVVETEGYVGFPPPAGPTQVIITPATSNLWPYPGSTEIEPGITVENAVYACADAMNRIVYTSGSDGMVTAIGY